MNKYFHGDDIFKYQNIKYNFSSNIWPYFNFYEVFDFIKNNLDVIRNYPDPKYSELSYNLNRYLNTELNSIILGNGSIELFSTIALKYYGAHSLILQPTFVEYEKVCLNHNHKIKHIFELDEIKKYPDAQLVWICNPNNPTGKIIESEELILYIQNYQNFTFVVDEAYIDYSLKAESLISYVDRFKNLIIVRSFTKRFAIPGLRIGYLITNIELRNSLQQLLNTWNVNSLAQKVANYFLNNFEKYKLPLEEIYQLKSELVQSLQQNKHLKVLKSDMHYFLIQIFKFKSYELKEKLARDFGILIRDASNFYGLDDSYIRISTLNREANLHLINSIYKILSD